MSQMRCQTSTRDLTARRRAGNRLMTKKVLLVDIKRTQNRLRLYVLCGKKTKRQTMVYARKSLSFAHKTRIKPTAGRGGKWRKMAKFVHQLRQILHRKGGGKWRILSGLWRIMARFAHQFRQILHRGGGGKWRILSQYVAQNGAKWRSLSISLDRFCIAGVAENGGLCRDYDGFWRICRANAPSIMAFLSALCDLCGKKIYGKIWRPPIPLPDPLPCANMTLWRVANRKTA